MDVGSAAYSHTEAISLIRADLKVREDSVYNSIEQLSLLYSGLQRCRRMKCALQAEEQQLQKQLEILNEDGGHSRMDLAQQHVVIDLLGSQSSVQAQVSTGAQGPRDAFNDDAESGGRSTASDRRT